MSHPFGDLLSQYRARKHGFSQTRLAHLIGYDQAVLTRMGQGKKDLTGPSGRERVMQIIGALHDEGVLSTLADANALLKAGGMAPLYEGQPAEAKLISHLISASSLVMGAVHHTNLPAPLAHFIGRAWELAELGKLLRLTRLLTLTGSGGAGKTRLAQHVAHDLAVHFADGVWYTELALLTDGALVAEAVAPAFGLSVGPRSARDQVLDYLRDRQALLLLDNCEHLIDNVATFILDLLRSCPRLSILATSREALNVEGESAWRVPPMQPDEANQLFVERARAARPDLALNPDNATITHICRRLDGMPLAIELAAARLQGLSLTDVATRLDDRFALLTGGRRGALPRHQTLLATLDWSYDLLSEPERILFRRLSVFVGGWSIAQAEQVCADGSLPAASVLPLLLDLVRKSLVVVEERDGETRYGYLETIREYGRQKLVEWGELERLQRRHAEVFALLAEQFHRASHGPEQRAWVARIERDYPNLRAALTWSFAPQGEPLYGCRIFSSLQVVWYAGTHAVDGQHWARLARSSLHDQMPPRVLGGVWLVSIAIDYSQTTDIALAGLQQALDYYTMADDKGGMADAMGNIGGHMLVRNAHDQAGRRMLEESVMIARTAGDVVIEHCSLLNLSWNAAILKEFDRAEALFCETIASCRATGDLANLSRALAGLAHSYMEQLEFRAALMYAQQAAEAARQITDYRIELEAECYIAEIVRYLGDAPRAVTLNEACLAFAREKLMPLDWGLPILTLSKALNDTGDQQRAQTLLHELITILNGNVGFQSGWYGPVFDTVACVASGRGDAARAASLFGVADTMFSLCDERRWLNNEWEYAPYIAKARAALDNEAYEAAYAEGRAMTREQAVAYALQGDEADGTSIRRSVTAVPGAKGSLNQMSASS